MVGTRAFLLELALPLIALLILAGVMIVLLRSNRPKIKVRAAIAVVIFLLLVANGGFRFVRELQYRSTLQNLASAAVESIQVGNTKIQSTADVNSVLGAVHDLRWYKPTAGDGGWAQAVDMVIRLKSGEEQYYRVGRHLGQEGAVIDFISHNPNSSFVAHYGYGFAEHLPSVLDKIGASLPMEKKNDP